MEKQTPFARYGTRGTGLSVTASTFNASIRKNAKAEGAGI